MSKPTEVTVKPIFEQGDSVKEVSGLIKVPVETSRGENTKRYDSAYTKVLCS